MCFQQKINNINQLKFKKSNKLNNKINKEFMLPYRIHFFYKNNKNKNIIN